MKKQFIDQLNAGDRLDDIFVLTEKSVAQKKNGENYLKITISDKSGTISGNIWDNADQIGSVVKSGDFVHVTGGISEYRGALQVTPKTMTPCERDTINPADFLPVSPYPPEKMFERLRLEAETHIRDEYIKKLVNVFFDDPDFARRFMTAPAAKKMHHAYSGGLLEHTLSMTILARKMAEHYRNYRGGIDLDLLIAGAIFHDIGKIREFQYDYVIDYTDEGGLINHIVIGCGMVDEKIRKIEGFPEETAWKIKHMIVSHHGTREFGSPEPPKIIEAVLLHHIDNIDAKMNGILEFIAKEDPDEAWTGFSPMTGTRIYKGKQSRE